MVILVETSITLCVSRSLTISLELPLIRKWSLSKETEDTMDTNNRQTTTIMGTVDMGMGIMTEEGMAKEALVS